MRKRLLVLTMLGMLGMLLSGCFMVPIAFVGPAVSGFSTASITQSAFTTGASFIVKKSTGKTIAEHAFDAVVGDSIKQSYLPKEKENVATLIAQKSKPIK